MDFEETLFRLEEVDAYIKLVRKAGKDALSAFLFKHQTQLPEFNDLSLPFLSWVYYNKKFSEHSVPEIQAFIHRDIQRSKHIIGKEIFTKDKIDYFPELEETYKNARNIIQQVWPEIHILLEKLLVRLSFVPPEQSDRFESISDPKQIGEIYFNMKRSSVVGWCEILVHEIAHQYLFIISSKPGFYEGTTWSEESFSSIRKENRPLIGVLHGVFAQSAMINFSIRMLNCSDISELNRRDCEDILVRNASGFLRDFLFLEEKGITKKDLSLQLNLEAARIRLKSVPQFTN